MTCPGCGRTNRANARFCDECGTGLEAAAVDVSAERRQITVSFCDLANSVALSDRLDPEDFARLMRDYEAVGEEVMTTFGGNIAQYLGDGLVTYFGHPRADDRAAEHAVRAGLAIVDRIADLRRASGEDLHVRVGIHTAEAVIQAMGRGTRRDQLAFGDVVNVAARIQSAAPDDAVVITEPARALVRGGFRFESIGRPEMKGVSDPDEVFLVADVDEDFAVSSRRQRADRTPFVGRSAPLDAMTERWESAVEGRGGVVVISGDAGIGKSRLLEEFRRRLDGQRCAWVDASGVPYRSSTPFGMYSDLIVRSFGWTSSDDDLVRLQNLDDALSLAGVPVEAAGPAMASLIGADPPAGRYDLTPRSAAEQRTLVLETAITWITFTTTLAPLCVAIEDAQWLDPSSIELIDRLAAAAANEGHPLLIVLTARPEFDSGQLGPDHTEVVMLDELDVEDARRIAIAVHGDAVPAELLRQAGGVPLYVEEMVRAWGDAPGEFGTEDEAALPPTLRDTLVGHLDRAGRARTVAQMLAVLRTPVSVDVLARVFDLDPELARRQVEELVEMHLVNAHHAHDGTRYGFAHALVEEAAYESLLRSTRSDLHAQVADRVADADVTLAAQPEFMARHLEHAGRFDDACTRWQHAGSLAFDAFALTEAERRFERALRLVDDLSDPERRAVLSLSIHLSLAKLRNATHGPGSPETEHHFDEARRLSQRIENPTYAFETLVGSWSVATSRGEISTTQRIADQVCAIVPPDSEHPDAKFAAFTQLSACFQRGEVAEASRYVDLIFERPTVGRSALGVDVETIAVVHGGLTRFHEGRDDDAAALIDRFVAPGALENTWELCHSLMASCALGIAVGDADRVERDVGRMEAEAAANDLPSFKGWGTLYRGWLAVHRGELDDGVALVRAGIEAYTATGQTSGIRQYHCWLAEALARMGRHPDAISELHAARRVLPEEVINEPRFLAQEARSIVAIDHADVDRAVALVEDALAMAERFGSVPLAEFARETRSDLAVIQHSAPTTGVSP